MSTTPLPRMPACQHKDVQHQRRYIGDVYTRDQMQAYATAARADLEAENARLREALNGANEIVKQTLAAAPPAQQPQAEPVFRDMRDMANAVWAEAEAVQRAVVYGPIPHDHGAAPQQQAEAVPSDVARDAARLDWLIDGAGRRIAIDSFGGQYRIVDPTASLVVTDWYPTKREAIDASKDRP